MPMLAMLLSATYHSELMPHLRNEQLWNCARTVGNWLDGWVREEMARLQAEKIEAAR